MTDKFFSRGIGRENKDEQVNQVGKPKNFKEGHGPPLIVGNFVTGRRKESGEEEYFSNLSSFRFRLSSIFQLEYFATAKISTVKGTCANTTCKRVRIGRVLVYVRNVGGGFLRIIIRVRLKDNEISHKVKS